VHPCWWRTCLIRPMESRSTSSSMTRARRRSISPRAVRLRRARQRPSAERHGQRDPLRNRPSADPQLCGAHERSAALLRRSSSGQVAPGNGPSRTSHNPGSVGAGRRHLPPVRGRTLRSDLMAARVAHFRRNAARAIHSRAPHNAITDRGVTKARGPTGRPHRSSSVIIRKPTTRTRGRRPRTAPSTPPTERP
jgi:hypothetical protein